jgi:hypothetical protein
MRLLSQIYIKETLTKARKFLTNRVMMVYLKENLILESQPHGLGTGPNSKSLQKLRNRKTTFLGR